MALATRRADHCRPSSILHRRPEICTKFKETRTSHIVRRLKNNVSIPCVDVIFIAAAIFWKAQQPGHTLLR
jgi:hypothetical protein